MLTIILDLGITLFIFSFNRTCTFWMGHTIDQIAHLKIYRQFLYIHNCHHHHLQHYKNIFLVHRAIFNNYSGPVPLIHYHQCYLLAI